MNRRFWTLLLVLLLFAGITTGCGREADQEAVVTGGEAGETDVPDTGTTRLTVFIAGSLMAPFVELEAAYEAAHPEVDVLVEAHGSIQVIRHVTEIGDQIDVIFPADYNLIPMLMYETPVPESDEMFADWYLEYAGNRLVLAYTQDSLYGDEIDEENWYEIIANQEVRLGLSDPRFDSSGYRTLMIGQLAEGYYGDPTIFEDIFLGRFKTSISVKKSVGVSVIHVPEVLEPSDNSNILMRGSSIALIALLESGEIDYAFEYESVIKQQGLLYVPLPDELNLGNPTLAEVYASVQVQLDFRRFSSVTPVFDGVPIGYGVTIPANALHREQALDFIAFVVGPEGQAIMAASDHPALEMGRSDDCAAVPEALRGFCGE